MTLDTSGPDWLTLTEAAARTGHSREALRQRVRRGKLRSMTGNDGVVRVDARQLLDLPPPSDNQASSVDDQVDTAEADQGETVDVLRTYVDDLRTTVDSLRSSLDKAHADQLLDRGRAERAEAQAAAEAKRADAAEQRLAKVEAELSEARTPLLVRLVRTFRGTGG